jgi:hypothetical protein
MVFHNYLVIDEGLIDLKSFFTLVQYEGNVGLIVVYF